MDSESFKKAFEEVTRICKDLLTRPRMPQDRFRPPVFTDKDSQRYWDQRKADLEREYRDWQRDDSR